MTKILDEYFELIQINHGCIPPRFLSPLYQTGSGRSKRAHSNGWEKERITQDQPEAKTLDWNDSVHDSRAALPSSISMHSYFGCIVVRK